MFIIMAATLEEFFADGLMEPSPPSPSIFLNLTLMPDPDTADKGQVSHDDLLLPNISCMLMEDDIDDKLLHQYSDHPALLQAQRPFAQIISSPFVGANIDDEDKGDVDQAKDLLVSSSDKTTLSSSDGEYAVGELLKGMKDASKFLPSDNSLINDHQMNQMFIRSKSKHLEEVGRSTKIMMMTLGARRDWHP
jgi:hypothetical protein